MHTTELLSGVGVPKNRQEASTIGSQLQDQDHSYGWQIPANLPRAAVKQ